MKYSILALSLLVSFANAMEDRTLCKACAAPKENKPEVITTMVGKMISLDMFTRDLIANVYYYPQITHDETILGFVKENQERKDDRITCTRQYLALKKGTTNIKFGLHGTSFGKYLGCVSYTVVVE